MNAARDNIVEILERLDARFPEAHCELRYETPFQLLVAVVLSAQCTDKRVNEVTKTLFAELKTPSDFAACPPERLESLIYSCGFYRAKARNLIRLSRDIIERFDGRVPDTREALCRLAGVGRKTANVVYGEAFNGQAVAVDTHVFRVSHRLGLSKGKTPDETERDLVRVLPPDRLTDAHHLLIFLGRYICKAQRPDCAACPVSAFCQYYTNKEIEPVL